MNICIMFSSNRALEKFIPTFTIKTRFFPNNNGNICHNFISTSVHCSAHDDNDLSNKVLMFNITY